MGAAHSIEPTSSWNTRATVDELSCSSGAVCCSSLLDASPSYSCCVHKWSIRLIDNCKAKSTVGRLYDMHASLLVSFLISSKQLLIKSPQVSYLLQNVIQTDGSNDMFFKMSSRKFIQMRSCTGSSKAASTAYFCSRPLCRIPIYFSKTITFIVLSNVHSITGLSNIG